MLKQYGGLDTLSSRKIHSGRKYKNILIRRIVVQYFFSLIGFIIGFIFTVIFLYDITTSITWQPYDPLYIILHFVKEYILLFMGIPIIAGWAFITYLFMRRPLIYLDEVISASEQLAQPTNEQIILSDAMKNVQDELNHVRATALRSDLLAREAEQRKNDLIVYLAHDLKTPLTSVIGYLTLLHDESQISEELRKKYLSISLEKAERLEDLINEFFEITRFNLSNITLQYTKVNLTRLLEQLVFEFRPMLLEKNLQCSLIAEHDIMISCDVDKLQRVFDNLLRNAVFYSYESSKIEIKVDNNDNFLKILFINHGDNISEDKLNRIFEQFYRLDTSRSSRNGGAGLGLAIAKEIIELHNGSIKAKSENELIEFEVTIPIS